MKSLAFGVWAKGASLHPNHGKFCRALNSMLHDRDQNFRSSSRYPRIFLTASAPISLKGCLEERPLSQCSVSRKSYALPLRISSSNGQVSSKV